MPSVAGQYTVSDISNPARDDDNAVDSCTRDHVDRRVGIWGIPYCVRTSLGGFLTGVVSGGRFLLVNIGLSYSSDESVELKTITSACWRVVLWREFATLGFPRLFDNI